MIRFDELPDNSGIDLGRQETVEPDLSFEDQALFYALDTEVEDVAVTQRAGDMFEVKIARYVPSVVIAHLKRHWEAGGWLVGVFDILDEQGRPLREQPGDDMQHALRMIFARPPKPQHIVSKAVVESLEMRQSAVEFVPPSEADVDLILSTSKAIRTSTPLLVRMPTRARPIQALEVLAKYRSMATSQVAIEVVIDADDETCNNTQFLQALSDLDCYVTVGNHKTKIEACNGGRKDDWDILMLASDDMWPMAPGYDQKIIAAMDKHFPLRDGALNFHDGYNRDHVRPGEPITCTLPVIGRHLYEEYGWVYFPQYRSIYSDTDQSFLWSMRNRIVFVNEMIVEHRHFANDKAVFDELYKHNSQHDDHDRLLFEERRARNFSYKPPTLSILICSIRPRRKQLDRLVDYLRWQAADHVGEVEIFVDIDDEATVGDKRQRLLERACGEYVCFIDDDDWVHERYIERVLAACAEGKDCCSLVGVITENGQNPRRFDHSIKNDGWYTREDGSFARTPNHLNAVRRSLALKAGFASKNVGEDHEYAKALVPLLKSEASAGDEPLYMYWSVSAKSVQSGSAR